MAVFNHDMEIASPIAPSRMFKAFILDSDELIPKLVPQGIKSIETLEGDGGPGSIKKITFSEASQYQYVKHKIEAVDKEKLTYAYTLIEGDALGDRLEKICYEVKFERGADGGSICKCSSQYYTKGDAELKEEEINAGREKAMGLFKAVEAYLLANPDSYLCN